MEFDDTYFRIVLNLMKILWVEEIDPRSADVDAAVGILLEETKSICELMADKDNGLEISQKLPVGYLEKKLANWTLAIPWPLVEYFPDDPLLDDLCKLAETIKIGNASNLCISGSACHTSRAPYIGDVDFCEYAFDDSQAIISSLVEKLTKIFPVCIPIEVKMYSDSKEGNLKIICPWPDREHDYGDDHRQFVRDAGSRQSKTDYIGHLPRYGAMPVTAMLLPSDRSKSKTGISSRSFSFQEAVIVDRAVDSVWPLVETHEILAYFKFLLGDVIHYISSRPIKAVKRASVLARFLHLPAMDLSLSEALSSDYAAEDAAGSRRSELNRMTAQILAEDRLDHDWRTEVEKVNPGHYMVYTDGSRPHVFGEGDARSLVENFIGDLRTRIGSLDLALERHLFASAV